MDKMEKDLLEKKTEIAALKEKVLTTPVLCVPDTISVYYCLPTSWDESLSGEIMTNLFPSEPS